MGNVTGSIAAKLAFFPPDPPTYSVRKKNGKLVFSGINVDDKNTYVHILETKSGNNVIAMFWKHPSARFTVLYSHGNAGDLGQMQELFAALRSHLRVNIMGLFSFLFFDLCCFFFVICFLIWILYVFLVKPGKRVFDVFVVIVLLHGLWMFFIILV